MARTYAVLELDKDVKPIGWELVLSAFKEMRILRKLRKNGFYAGFATIEELNADCLRLSPPSALETLARICNEMSKISSPARKLPAEVDTWNQFGFTQKVEETLGQNLLKAGSQELLNLNNCRVKLEPDVNPTLGNPFLGGIKPVEQMGDRSCIGQSHIRGKDNDVSQVPARAETGINLNENNNNLKVGKAAYDTGSEFDNNRRPATGDLMSDLQNRGTKHRRISDSAKSDADSDGSPICFKRPRKGTAIGERMPLERPESATENLGLVSHLNVSKKNCMVVQNIDDGNICAGEANRNIFSDSESDSEPVILKRPFSGRKKVGSPCIYNETILGEQRNPDDGACLFPDNGGTRVRQQELDQAASSIKIDSNLKIHDRGRCRFTVNEDDVKQRIRNLIKESYQNCQSQHSLLERKCSPVSATLAKLSSIASLGKEAVRCLESGGSSTDVETIFPRKLLKDFEKYKAELDDYAAMDQYFPSVNKQKEVAEKMNCYVDDGDTLLEISGRANDFFSLLKERLSKSGKKIDYKNLLLRSLNRAGSVKEWFIEENNLLAGFNLIPGTLGEWFIEGKVLPTGSNLIICVSPCFELRQQQLKELLAIMIQRKPKLICSIFPPILSQRLEERNYELVWEDQQVLKGEVLWPWGMMDIPEITIDPETGISLCVHLWSRSDWATKHRQVASHFGHIPKQAREVAQSPRLQPKLIPHKTEHVNFKPERGISRDSSQYSDLRRPLSGDSFSNNRDQAELDVSASSCLRHDETMKDPNEYHSNRCEELSYKANVVDARWPVMCCGMSS